MAKTVLDGGVQLLLSFNRQVLFCAHKLLTMKQIVFALAAVLLLCVAACKKESKTLSCRLVSRVNAADSAIVSYDAQRRVSTYEIVGESVYTFNYTSGLSAQCVVSIPSNPTYTTYYIFLNSNGTISSMNNSMVISGSTYDYSYSFKYNTDGRIIRCDQMLEQVGGGSSSIKYDSMVYENGSLVKQLTYYATTTTGPYTLQEYSVSTPTDKTNRIGYHAFSYYEEPITMLSGFYPFYHLFGKGSDKLPSETSFYSASGTLSFKMSYNYLFDANDNVQEMNIARTIFAPSTENRRFYYSCE